MKKEKSIEDLLVAFNDMEIKENEELLPDSWKKSTIDYAVYTTLENEKKIPFAFIVCTSESTKVPVNRTYAKKLIKHIVNDTVAWMGLVIDKDSIFLYEPATQKWTKDVTISKVGDAIAEVWAKEKNFNESAFKKELANSMDSLKLDTKRKKAIASILKASIAANNLKRVGRTVSFDFESQFKLICDVLKEAKVKPFNIFCRYSSIGSLYRNVFGGNESMCGLAGMNDKSEGFYLGHCLSPNSTFDISRKSQWVVDNYNKAFISSLCNEKKADNLTMWRLYGGNDGDGVCLIYELDMVNIKKSKEFILAPVLYGDRNNVVVQLFRLISNLPFVNGYQFVIADRDVWAYFVKPADFSIEEEYRLLYIDDGQNPTGKTKWIYNSGVGIVHPVIEFALNDYPLKLKKIILGPKCRESGVNRVQLQSWLSSMSREIEVVESDIKIYR